MNLPEGFVPDTVYLLETEGEYVGIFNLRHRLTEGLIHGAGHIGYGISPKYRGKGYAAKGLETVSYTHLDVYKRQILKNHLSGRKISI